MCIDRDNDIGEKTGISGPIIGHQENLKAAEALALADPEDTDVNALFAAIKIAKKLETEVVTVTGDISIGVVSDTKVAEQLDKIIKDLKPESVIVVTDGADDEQLLPVVQSRVKINSVQTIVVRQSKELEKAYFTVTNFLREVSEEPSTARLLFALPGVILVLLVLGGLSALNYIVLVIGAYFIIKGLGFEEQFFGWISSFIKSLSIERISTITYITSVIVLMVGLGYGYADMQRSPIDSNNINSTLDSMAIFVLNSPSIDLILLAVAIATIGKSVDDYNLKKYIAIRKYLILLAFTVMVKVLISSWANFWINEAFGLGDFIFFVTLAIIGFGMWIRFTEYIFIGEIQSIKRTIEDLTGKEVYNKEGKHLGKVNKVVMNGQTLKNIKVGKKKIPGEDIISRDTVIVVKTE